MAKLTKLKKVCMRRQWDDYRIGEIEFDKLENLHWNNISGGVYAVMSHYFVCGYALCTDIKGDIAHSCKHGECPHSIKVCIMKKDNSPKVFREILEIVGPKPKREKKRNENRFYCVRVK